MGVRHAAALTLALLSCAVPSAQGSKPTVERALTLVRTYLADWQETFASLVADEEYTQELRPTPSPFLVRDPSHLSPQTRELRSEVLLLRAPAEDAWVSFRDVRSVDGRPVTDRQRRFEELFAGPVATMISTARKIADEGARFNLGRLTRTINTPTAALLFLQSKYHANTSWHLDAGARLRGHRVWELAFDQRKAPFAIAIPGTARHSASGSFWIELGTGRILQWELVVRAAKSTFRVTVAYGAVPAISEGWVPLRMEERYDAPQLERLRGVALYTNHRLFRTAGRVIGEE